MRFETISASILMGYAMATTPIYKHDDGFYHVKPSGAPLYSEYYLSTLKDTSHFQITCQSVQFTGNFCFCTMRLSGQLNEVDNADTAHLPDLVCAPKNANDMFFLASRGKMLTPEGDCLVEIDETKLGDIKGLATVKGALCNTEYYRKDPIETNRINLLEMKETRRTMEEKAALKDRRPSVESRIAARRSSSHGDADPRVSSGSLEAISAATRTGYSSRLSQVDNIASMMEAARAIEARRQQATGMPTSVAPPDTEIVSRDRSASIAARERTSNPLRTSLTSERVVVGRENDRRSNSDVTPPFIAPPPDSRRRGHSAEENSHDIRAPPLTPRDIGSMWGAGLFF